MIILEDLRKAIYKKYDRRKLSKILNISPVQVSRILNDESKISIERYNKLVKLLGDKI